MTLLSGLSVGPDQTQIDAPVERYALPVVVSFLLSYALIVVGLVFHLYVFILGDFRWSLSFSELVPNLSLTLFPYTESLLLLVAVICVFVRRVWLKLLLLVAAFVSVTIFFGRVIPGDLAGAGLVIVYMINLLVIGLVTVGVLFAQKTGSRRVIWRFNAFLGVLVVLVLLLNAFIVLQHTSQEANFERVFERVQAGEYAGVEEGLALCNTIRERSDRRQCMKELGMRENDVSICYAWSDTCVQEVASSLRNPALCASSPQVYPPNNHVDDFWPSRDAQIRSCIRSSVAEETDVRVCEGLPDTWLLGECIRAVARNQQSIETCMLIDAYHLTNREPHPWEEKQYYIRDSCLKDVIPQVGTLSDCQKIVSNRPQRLRCERIMSD